MKESSVKVKKALPAIAVLLIIAVMIAAAFVPVVRSGAVREQAVLYADAVDSRAMEALNNARAYVDGNDFSTSLTGSVKARVFGIPYTQNMSGTRVYKDGKFVGTVESKSALVKVGFKTVAEDGKYTVARGKYKRKGFDYGSAAEYGYSDYVAAFGKPDIGLVKYDLDGAVTKAVAGDDGSYTFTLDVKRAAQYCGNAVKSILGTEKYPQYKSVEFTLYTDGERPVKVVTREQFRVDKYGGVDCTAECTEIFTWD